MRTTLFLRGLWWRRGLSATVLVVAAITLTVATIGPIYARAAAESTLTDRLASAPASASGLSFSEAQDVSEPGDLYDLRTGIPSRSALPGYGAPIASEQAPVTARVPGEPGTVISSMVWRDGQCAHLIIISGHCPTAAGQALVDDNAVAGTPGWRVGQTLSIYQTTGPSSDGEAVTGSPLTTATIVGSYRPRSTTDPFWFDRQYFTSHINPSLAVGLSGFVDAIFVTQQTFASSAPGVSGEVGIDYPLDAKAFHLADVATLGTRVAALQRQFPPIASGDPSQTTLTTSVPALLDAAGAERRQIGVATWLVIVELSLLAWLVLFRAVTESVESRGNELALAKLRGLGVRDLVALALAEPLALITVAVPLGMVAAVGVVHLFAHSVLVGGTPVTVPASAWGALGAAYAGALVASVVAGTRTTTRDVLDQWRGARTRRSTSRIGLALEVLLAAVAIALAVRVTSLPAGSRPAAIYLAAPGAGILAIALLGLRLLPLAARSALRVTRASHRIALFLALRQTVRRPGGLRLAALLAVAAGLATFAVAGEAVAHANRIDRAQTELGAAQVVSVQYRPTHDPEQVVDTIDPDGRWAMASAAWVPDGGDYTGQVTGDVLGVQPARLTAVGYRVRGELSPSAIASAIGVASATPAPFTGTSLRVQVTDETPVIGGPVGVVLMVRSQHLPPQSIPAGDLSLGTHQYQATVACAAGCTFAGITWAAPAGSISPVSGSATVDAITTVGRDGDVHQVAADLQRDSAWRSGSLGDGAGTTSHAGPNGLSVTFQSSAGASAILAYADSPTPIPIVGTPAAVTGPTGSLIDFTGTTVRYAERSSTSVLPSVLDDGAVADLDYLRLQLPDFDAEAMWTVWLSAHAPADAVDRLRAAGLIVQDVHTETGRVAALGRQGPALSLLLLLVCAVAASVLAVGGTALAIASEGRRRSFELAALRVIGVGANTLRRSAALEQTLLLGSALVLAVPSGYLAALAVIRVVPEFSDATPVVLHYDPPWVAVLLAAAALTVLLAATAVLAGVWLVRSAVASRLRELER